MAGLSRSSFGPTPRLPGEAFELVGPAEDNPPPRKLSTRGKARRDALDILYEAEQRGFTPLEMLSERTCIPARENPPREFTSQIVTGVAEHAGAIDDAIATYAQGWSLDRLPAVDRAALRVGVWEILYHDDTPDGVAVSEAVGLVADLSTDSSPGFVNGLLSKIAEVKDTLR